MKFKEYIFELLDVNEAAYRNNIGFAEMVKFYKKADKKDISKMEKIIKNNNWEAFKELIRKTLNIELK